MDEGHKRRAYWDSAHMEYTCADGVTVIYDFGQTRIGSTSTPRNGLWLRQGKSLVLVIGEV